MTDRSALGDLSQLFRHTIPIFNYDRAQPSLTGTGVFIAVDDRKFVVTAAHVFESSFQKIAFGYLATEGLKIFGAERMPILRAKAQSNAGDPQRAVYKDGLDLAVIEPPSEVLQDFHPHYIAFDLRQSDYEPTVEWGVLSGWPARKNSYNPKKRIGKFNTCYHIQCPIVGAEKIRRLDWNPDIYFGLSADKKKDFASEATGKSIQLPKLEGLSGSGFWVNRRSGSEWALAGIVIEDDEPNRMLKVIKVHHVWTPLRHFGIAPP